MKILSITFNNTKTQPLQKQNPFCLRHQKAVDAISFSAKPQQINLNAEAKNILKVSHGVLSQSRKIQTRAQDCYNQSLQIQQEAKQIQVLANEEWEEISNFLDYARKNKTVAISDPKTKTDIFLQTNEAKTSTTIYEYKNDKLHRKVLNKPNYTAVYTYNNDKTTRKIFETQSGALHKFDSNICFPNSTTESQQSYLFENGMLKRYSRNLKQFGENHSAEIMFNFKNGEIEEIITNPVVKNGFESSDEYFRYSENSLTRYIKKAQSKNESQKTSEEDYVFEDNIITYSKNKNTIANTILTQDIVLQFSNSKLKRAFLNPSQGQNIKTAEKIFTFDSKEKPQYCYLICHSKIDGDIFNPTDYDYDNLVWLGGKKS